MLAKTSQLLRLHRMGALSLTFFASKLAPTMLISGDLHEPGRLHHYRRRHRRRVHRVLVVAARQGSGAGA
ncbi:hypothetical protein DD985_14865 [Pseudomonas sp. HMWF011]|nr:hypothetical protein C2U56_20755 [Pseudomonas fluorescens]PTT11782.1 hypothetical protein DBR14_12815 [Pseudomonas sp. HMWF034]PVV70706.1 hypothetical protein DD985_14865 [Pseudomonas sp. HMWF011]